MKLKYMASSLVVFFSVISTLGAIAFAEVPSESVRFYYGSVKYSSPDGNMPYGATVSLVKRTISPQSSTIIEAVLQPARKSGEPPVEFITTLSRRNSSTIFDTTDAEHSFSGTINFKGDEWNWSEWTYEVAMTSGGKIEGRGGLSEVGLFTDKLMSDVAGKPTVRIKEELPAISAEKYIEIRKQLLGS